MKLSLISIVIFVCLLAINSAQSAEMNLVNAWTFDEGNGGVVNDSVGNAKGELMGDLDWTDGKFGKALQFPGQGDSYVTIPHSDSMDADPYTFVAWLKLEAASWQYIVWKNGLTWPETHAKRHMDIWIHDADYSVAMWSADGAGDYERIDGTAIVADGTWHHIAMSSDTETMRLFIDGELDGEAPISGNLLVNEEDPMWIGARPGDVAATGVIDEVGIFAKALSEDELKMVMSDGLLALSPVEPAGKLTATWGTLKK